MNVIAKPIPKNKRNEVVAIFRFVINAFESRKYTAEDCHSLYSNLILVEIPIAIGTQ
jgi:hypothetical protein